MLGVVIDRNGAGGVAALRWMRAQPNVRLLLGNHEAMLLDCAFLFREGLTANGDPGALERLMIWVQNGAGPTIDALRALRGSDPEALEDLLLYLREAPLYARTRAGDRDFLLVHAGLGHFRPRRSLDDYAPDELLWHRPRPHERYFSDVTTVLGHTPAAYYGAPGRMFVTKTWVDIDAGAAGGAPPMLLRLDDMRPFYRNAAGECFSP